MIDRLYERLPDPQIDNFDIDAAESDAALGSLKYIKKARGAGAESGTPGGGDAGAQNAVVKKKKNKKKKPKLPQNYDPTKPVDPERWLPRYERSGYKPKKSRRGRADVGKGTQGASSEAMEA